MTLIELTVIMLLALFCILAIGVCAFLLVRWAGMCCCLALILLSGCSAFDFQTFSVVDLTTRAMSPNIIRNGKDTGYATRAGFTISDALVVSMVEDAQGVARGLVSQYNGATNAAALTQTALSSVIGIIALAGGPVSAAGGVAASSVIAGDIFTRINSPAQANAFAQFVDRNESLAAQYWTDLMAETCSNNVSGAVTTQAGLALNVGFIHSVMALEKGRQGLQATLEQLQGATIPAGARLASKSRAAGCPPTTTARTTIP